MDPSKIFNDSLSIHLNKFIDAGILFKSDPEYEYGAKPGDAVIIIILGHGEWDKGKTLAPVGIRLGNNFYVQAILPFQYKLLDLHEACQG